MHLPKKFYFLHLIRFTFYFSKYPPVFATTQHRHSNLKLRHLSQSQRFHILGFSSAYTPGSVLSLHNPPGLKRKTLCSSKLPTSLPRDLSARAMIYPESYVGIWRLSLVEPPSCGLFTTNQLLENSFGGFKAWVWWMDGWWMGWDVGVRQCRGFMDVLVRLV